MSQSHAPTPPWPSISLELSLHCNLFSSLFPAHKRHHARRCFHPLSLSASDSLPAPLLRLSPLITVCSYKNKTHGWKDVQFSQENEETQIHHVFLLLLAHTVAHRGGNCGSNGYHNSVVNRQRTDTTVLTPTQPAACHSRCPLINPNLETGLQPLQ